MTLRTDQSAEQPRRRYAAVVGPGGDVDSGLLSLATEVGRGLARHDVIVVTGGIGGVGAAASRGAVDEGGVSLGLLPGEDRATGHPWLSIAIPTGLGELRNGLIVRAADVVISVGGSWGTLSEVALAVRSGVPVVALRPWQVSGDGAETAGLIEVETASDAVDAAVTAATRQD